MYTCYCRRAETMKKIKLYTVVKHDTGITGYWIDKDTIYKDKIRIVDYSDFTALRQGIKALFDIGEKAVFYSINNIGYCEYADGKKEIFPHRDIIHVYTTSDIYIKDLLKKYGGFTLYEINDKRYIEIYKTI
jgi:hypothetical protein